MNPNTDPIPFALPSLDEAEERAVLEVMRSGWLTTGKVTLAFEEEFAAFTGSPRALAVNSATSGLHLALEAVGIGPGDTVVTSAYTFASTAAVARHLGAEVAFCDVEPGGYNIGPAGLERVLARTKNCRAVIPVHIGGLPCDMEGIRAVASRYGCAIIEDAAHAFPSRTRNGFAGTLGDIGVYSFYVTKTITTGEGGMIVTANPKYAARMARMRMHGIDREVWDRYTSKNASWRYAVVEAGYKYNLPDLLSAIGRVQLGKADRFLAERKAIAAIYDGAFSPDPGFEVPPSGEGHAWHLYTLRLAGGTAAAEAGAVTVTADAPASRRDGFIESLRETGIGASVHFIPLHKMPYWAKRYGLVPGDFPNAMDTWSRSVSLPIFQGMTAAQAERVADAVSALGRRPRTA